MTSKFLMVRDSAGFNSFGLLPDSVKYQGILTAGAEQTITVPTFAIDNTVNVVAIFYFQPGSSVWVSYNATAVAPTGAAAATSSEGNPTTRQYKSGNVLHFITNDASDEFGVIFYPNY